MQVCIFITPCAGLVLKVINLSFVKLPGITALAAVRGRFRIVVDGGQLGTRYLYIQRVYDRPHLPPRLTTTLDTVKFFLLIEDHAIVAENIHWETFVPSGP